jgi:hypothetical protein
MGAINGHLYLITRYDDVSCDAYLFELFHVQRIIPSLDNNCLAAELFF